MKRGPKVKTQRDQYIAELYKSGKSLDEVAALYGISGARIYQIVRKHGVARPDGVKHKKAKESPRNIEIAEMYKSGKTLEEVGAAYGITRERARQIIAAQGLTKIDGGEAIRIFKGTHDRIAAAKGYSEKCEAKCRERWGMSIADYRAHVAQYGNTSNKGSPLRKFMQQRTNAHTRSIKWEITFAQWWALWVESGKWELRGRGQGYVMARHGDTGSYSVDNVYICTAGENARDSYITKPAQIRFANCGTAAGTGKGWCIVKKNKKNPYQARFRNKYLGAFPTPEAAHAAYLAAANAANKEAA